MCPNSEQLLSKRPRLLQWRCSRFHARVYMIVTHHVASVQSPSCKQCVLDPPARLKSRSWTLAAIVSSLLIYFHFSELNMFSVNKESKKKKEFCFITPCLWHIAFAPVYELGCVHLDWVHSQVFLCFCKNVQLNCHGFTLHIQTDIQL